MADDTVLQVWTRSTLPTVAPNQQYTMGLSGMGALQVQQIEPVNSALAQNGYIYGLSAGVVANAQASIQQIPTTAATWALYNNSPTGAGGYCVVPLKIGVWLASGTSGVGGTLIGGLSTAAQAAAISNATGIVGPKSLSASAAQRTSLATIGVSATLAGAPAWLPIGNFLNHAAAATPGTGGVFNLDGMFVIPPKFALGLDVFSGAGTTALYAVSVIYAEIPLYLV